jgi:hypothetical protein
MPAAGAVFSLAVSERKESAVIFDLAPESGWGTVTVFRSAVWLHTAQTCPNLLLQPLDRAYSLDFPKSF